MPTGKGPGQVLTEKVCNFERNKGAEDTTLSFMEFKLMGIVVKSIYFYLHLHLCIYFYFYTHTHKWLQVFSIALEVREIFSAPGYQTK